MNKFKPGDRVVVNGVCDGLVLSHVRGKVKSMKDLGNENSLTRIIFDNPIPNPFNNNDVDDLIFEWSFYNDDFNDYSIMFEQPREIMTDEEYESIFV